MFDNGVPKPVARGLQNHEVSFAREINWHELENGELILRAESSGFDLLLSTDKNIRYQQNLKYRRIALVILGNTRWPLIQLHLDAIAEAVERSTPGSYTEVAIPFQ